jgi:hypothetical protein
MSRAGALLCQQGSSKERPGCIQHQPGVAASTQTALSCSFVGDAPFFGSGSGRPVGISMTAGLNLAWSANETQPQGCRADGNVLCELSLLVVLRQRPRLTTAW